MESYGGDTEGSVLAAQIVSCFDLAKGPEIEGSVASIIPLGGFGAGIFVSGKDEEKELMDAIRDAFGRARLVISPGNGHFPGNIGFQPPNAIVDANVLVGVKPIAPMTVE